MKKHSRMAFVVGIGLSMALPALAAETTAPEKTVSKKSEKKCPHCHKAKKDCDCHKDKTHTE